MPAIRACSMPSRPTRTRRSALCRRRPTASRTRLRSSRRSAGAGGGAPTWRGPNMANKPTRGVLALAAATALLVAGCSGKDHNTEAKPAAGGVSLTAAQRQHIRLFTIRPASFEGTVQTFGVVDFDNDQATTVLAPFGGPVTGILVVQGQHVAKGQALAVVNSADFSAAVNTYRKAAAAA